MEHHWKNPSGNVGTRNEWEKTVLLNSGLDASFFGDAYDGLEDKACLLTSDTGDAGSSPHVAQKGFFNDVPWQILLYI